MVAPTVFMEEEWGETPLTDEKVAGEDEENEATPSVAESVCPSVAMVEVAGEDEENEAEPGVANAEVVDSHCVAGEETEMDSHCVAGEETEVISPWVVSQIVTKQGRFHMTNSY